MTNTLWIYALLSVPLLISLLCFACRWLGEARRAVTGLHTAGIVLTCALSMLVINAEMASGALLALHQWIYIDSLGALFIGIIGVIGLLAGLYSIGYMGHEVEHGEVSVTTLCSYYGFFHLFLFTMLLAVTANNIIMMWVAIEATTLSSAFLVGLYGQRSSLEAALSTSLSVPLAWRLGCTAPCWFTPTRPAFWQILVRLSSGPSCIRTPTCSTQR